MSPDTCGLYRWWGEWGIMALIHKVEEVIRSSQYKLSTGPLSPPHASIPSSPMLQLLGSSNLLEEHVHPLNRPWGHHFLHLAISAVATPITSHLPELCWPLWPIAVLSSIFSWIYNIWCSFVVVLLSFGREDKLLIWLIFVDFFHITWSMKWLKYWCLVSLKLLSAFGLIKLLILDGKCMAMEHVLI